MVKYVVEIGYNVNVYENKDKALNSYDYLVSRLTENEKNNIEYCRVYSIEAESDEQIEETADLIDLCVDIIEEV